MGLITEGRMVGADYDKGLFYLAVKIPNKEQLHPKNGDKLRVQLYDHRSKSAQQRRLVFALISDIAEYQGEDKLSTYEDLKIRFVKETDSVLPMSRYSLATSSVSVANEFIDFIVNFIIEYDIPTSKPLQESASDIYKYVWACAMNKKCAACGKGGTNDTMKADLHHFGQRVGMGRNRLQIDHIGMKCLPLCRMCHNRAHSMGDEAFANMYHLEPIEINQTIVDKYNLNG